MTLPNAVEPNSLVRAEREAALLGEGLDQAAALVDRKLGLSGVAKKLHNRAEKIPDGSLRRPRDR